MICASFKMQLRSLIDLTTYFRYCIKTIPLNERNKAYLRNLMKVVVNLQRCVRTLDEDYNLLHLQPVGIYTEGVKALKYDPFADFRKAVVEYDNLVNDTFLFVE